MLSATPRRICRLGIQLKTAITRNYPLLCCWKSEGGAVPRYVMDLFRGERVLVGRTFDAPDDVEAVVQANAVFLVNTAEDQRITAYRLRNPVPGSDWIFHSEYIGSERRSRMEPSAITVLNRRFSAHTMREHKPQD